MAGKDDDGFAWAVKNGDLNGESGVKYYVETKGLSVKFQDANKRTPLHWAADYNQKEVLEYLLSKGGKDALEHKDKYNFTPLAAAALEGHVETVQILLKHGAKADVTVNDGPLIDQVEKEEIKNLLKPAPIRKR